MTATRAPGYIKVYRQMADPLDRYWNEPRTFSPWEARIDLLLQARFTATVYSTSHGADRLERGEFVGSLNFWAARWRWHRNKVARFLHALSRHGFLAVQRPGHHGTIYRVVKYDYYQGLEAPTGTPTGIGVGQQRDKREEGKEGEEGKKVVVGEIADASATYALRLTVAANNAVTARWGEQTNPFHHGQSYTLARDLDDAGVPIDVAASAIERLCAASAKSSPPKSVNWFREGILSAHRTPPARQPSRPIGGAPAPAKSEYGKMFSDGGAS